MHQVEQALGRAATEQEVAERLNVSLEEYRQILLDTNTASFSRTTSIGKNTATVRNWSRRGMRKPTRCIS